MTNAIPNSGSAKLGRIMAEMNERGGFPIAVLTDQHGFPIAWSAEPDQDPGRQSAVVALVQKTASQASDKLSFEATDEISLRDEHGQRLICRPFLANGHLLILAILIPDSKQSYRRLTNKTINAIRRTWKL